jgi:DNA-directed RNA polymerase II subunit RPB1
MTLNTFHNSGISAKDVTQGVPRLNEILNVSKNIRTPSVTVHLKVTDDEREASDMISMLEYSTLGNLTMRTEIHYDPDPTATIIEDDKDLVEDFFQLGVEDVNTDYMSPWVLRIKLDKSAVNVKQLQLSDIAQQITGFFMNGVHVVYPDNNTDSDYVLRIRILADSVEASQGGLVFDQEGEGEASSIGTEDFEVLRRVEKSLLSSLHLSGVPGIKKVYLSNKSNTIWNEDKGKFDTKKEWVLETDGTNLSTILTLSDKIDHTTTVSNDINEMFHVLGIEGARSTVFAELHSILTSNDGYVNYRHIACLCDCMTFGGYIMSIDRHGINRGEAGPMLRASFEETVEVFMNSAVYSQYDMLNGVTENVMLGQLAQVGTGLVDLLVDPEKLKKAIPYHLDHLQMVDENVAGGVGQYYGVGVDSDDATPFASGQITGSTPGFGGFSSSTPFMGSFTPSASTPTATTPMYAASPYQSPARSPGTTAAYSPAYSPTYSPAESPRYSPSGSASPMYSASPAHGQSPRYSPDTPVYHVETPTYSPTSPSYSAAGGSPEVVYSPQSPSNFSDAMSPYSQSSPNGAASATSPAYSPLQASPTEGGASPTDVQYSPIMSPEDDAE